jgi:hypothetical protein
VYDNTGKPYDVSKILQHDFTFDHSAYQMYSPVFLPITYVLSYAMQFASLTALLSHTICWHGPDIVRQTKESMRTPTAELASPFQVVNARSTDALLGHSDVDHSLRKTESAASGTAYTDVHNRLMERYNDVPVSWYLTTGVTMLATGMFVVE